MVPTRDTKRLAIIFLLRKTIFAWIRMSFAIYVDSAAIESREPKSVESSTNVGLKWVKRCKLVSHGSTRSSDGDTILMKNLNQMAYESIGFSVHTLTFLESKSNRTHCAQSWSVKTRKTDSNSIHGGQFAPSDASNRFRSALLHFCINHILVDGECCLTWDVQSRFTKRCSGRCSICLWPTQIKTLNSMAFCARMAKTQVH